MGNFPPFSGQDQPVTSISIFSGIYEISCPFIRLPAQYMQKAVTIVPPMTASQNRHIADIIKAYQQRLRGFIRSRVPTEEDAEDILQDVFYQLVENTRLMRPIEQLTAWLFTVARNKITDSYRKQKPDALSSLAGAGEEEEGERLEWTELLFEDDDNPETAYLRSMVWTELEAALKELPEEQRLVFELHELEGMSYKEMAAFTGEGVNTLLSRKRYAVLFLRERLRVLYDELLNF